MWMRSAPSTRCRAGKMPIDPELAKEADAGMIEMYAGDYLDGAAQAVAKLLK